MICEKEKCLACLACVDACPVRAIDVFFDPKYGIIPKMNKDKCIHCGYCKKVCPIINYLTKKQAKYSIASYTRDIEDQKTCSSGGIATAFAREVFLKGGAVFGAAVIKGIPKMISVDTLDDIERLKGSKYVYCNPMGVYSTVKQKLKAGKNCLFIGTPCQIAGLRQFLGKEDKNLITIDLICHGTPPYEFLRDHFVKNKIDIDKVDSFSFRGKYDFFLTIYDKDGRILYKKNQYEDEYFLAFMKGYLFREVCYRCPFAESHRVSDISIGDYWGVGPDAMNGYKGKISLILLNTLKGKKFFESNNSNIVYEIRDISEAINGNDQLREPSNKPEKKDLFNDALIQKDLSNAFKIVGIDKIAMKNKIKNKIMFFPRIIKALINM